MELTETLAATCRKLGIERLRVATGDIELELAMAQDGSPAKASDNDRDQAKMSQALSADVLAARRKAELDRLMYAAGTGARSNTP